MSPRLRKQLPVPMASARPPGSLPPRPTQLGLVSGLCGLGALLVYLRTLCPTVFHGDSGEMIAVAATRGIAHPPGFPLHTLLASLFAELPLGSIAERVNGFSAVCGAGAALLLCRATARLTGDVWAGVLAGGIFALSPLVWPYAVSAEVFALNDLFVAGLLDLSVSAAAACDEPARLRRTLHLTAFWVGLGLSNHHVFVFVGPPIFAYLLSLAGREVLRPRLLLTLGGAAIAGFLPYLYLPLAARSVPEILWGDPSSLRGFLTHFFRVEYGTFRLAGAETGSGGLLLPRLALFARRIGETTLWIGPGLLAAAVPALVRRGVSRTLGCAWLAAAAFYLLTFSALANVRIDDPLHATVEARFWQQPLVILAALMGVGLCEATRRLGGSAARLLRPALGLGVPAALLVLNFGVMDQSRNVFFRDQGRAILDSLPERAILLITSDEAVGSVRYLQSVERVRPDVSVIPTGLLTLHWYRSFAERRLPDVTLPAHEGFSAREFMDANVGRRPVHLLNKVPWLQTQEEAYRPWPGGPTDRVLPKNETPALDPWIAGAEAGFARFDPGAPARFPVGSWERYVAENYWRQYERFGQAVVRAAAGRGSEPGVAALIARALTPLVERHPAPDPTLYKNLGVAYQFLAATHPDADAQKRRYWQRYLATNPASDPDLPAIREAVGQPR